MAAEYSWQPEVVVGGRDWFTRARVRSGPAPGPVSGAGRWFSTEAVPWRSTSLSVPAELDVELRRRALGRYLHATVMLETHVVNITARDMAEGIGPVRFGTQARRDAHRIYCDEGYHALLAFDLMDGLGLDPDAWARPAWLERLDALLLAEPDDDLRWLLRTLFTCVSETLVSPTLSVLATDRTLHPAVRGFAAEHLRDEAWHASVFGLRLGDLWRQSTEATRTRLGTRLPSLLEAFLRPDLADVRADLEALGAPDAAAQVVDPSPGLGDADRRAIEGSTMRHLRAAGLLAHGPTARALAEAGLRLE